jgi:hypothetical protein
MLLSLASVAYYHENRAEGKFRCDGFHSIDDDSI